MSAGARPSVAERVLVAFVRGYQRWISPALPPTCRFYPTCSAYAVEALQVHGVIRGLGLASWRLLRCAPWHPGGVDPVPPRHPDTAHRSPETGHRTRPAEDPEEQVPC
jgi:putative membrane protein insertion efficiency factor